MVVGKESSEASPEGAPDSPQSTGELSSAAGVLGSLAVEDALGGRRSS